MKEIKETKKIIYSILSEINKGEVEPTAKDYDLEVNDFGNILEMIQDKNVIKGFYSSKSDKHHVVFLKNAKITLDGLGYIDDLNKRRSIC